MAGKLTAKQAAFVRINALHQLARHIGLIPSHVALTPSPEEYKRRQERYAGVLILATETLLRDDTADTQKAAASVLLDCIFPEWRDRFPPELIGPTLDRDAPEVRAWRKAVLERDGYKCTECRNETGLEAHHIIPWAVEPRLRIVVENGLTLCRSCHQARHYG